MKKQGKLITIESLFRSIPYLFFGTLFACSGLSGGESGIKNAAAPSYPVGVAAPNADPRGNKGIAAKANYEDFKVKVQEVVSATDDANGGILYSLTLKGRAFCMPLNAKDFSPCGDGHNVRVFDTFLYKFVDTLTATQDNEAGHFEVTFHGIDPSKNPKDFSGDFSKYDKFLYYYLHLKDDYKPSVLDAEKPCVVDGGENNDCPPAGDYYPATVEN